MLNLGLTKDLNKTKMYYGKVKLAELNAIGKTQFLINKLMLSLSQSPKITPQIEVELADCLNFLKKNSVKNIQYIPLQMNLINFSAKEFRDRGEPAKGLMLYGKSSKPYAYHPMLGVGNVYTQIYTFATPAQIDEQLNVLNKADPNALEKFLREPNFSYTYNYDEQNKSEWDQNKLLDIKSMKLVQQDKLLLAYIAIKQIDTAYWNNDVNTVFKYDDPFCLNPWNGHDKMNFKNVSYNKKTFLKELIDLKLKVAKSNGEEKSQLLLRIANAYYSMTFHGKFWIMQKNYQGGWEPENNADVDPTYYSGARAKYYYKLILQTSQDAKLLGATMYILNTAFQTNAAQLEKNKAMIRANSKATDYYQQLSANCDLFIEYIRTLN